MNQRDREAQKIWDEMVAIESESLPADPHARRAAFAIRRRQIAKLKEQYQKALGGVRIDPNDPDAEHDRNLRIRNNPSPAGGVVDVHPTVDRLNRGYGPGIDPEKT